MRPLFKKIFLIFLVVMFVGWMLVTAVMDLTNKKDIHTVRIDECVLLMELEHSINGIIPMGKDYYYLGVDNAKNEAFVIKASKGWYNKNFGSDGAALQNGGLTLTSLSKKAQDFDVEEELAARTSQLTGLNFITAPGYSMELDYKFNAICKLILLALAVVLVLVGRKFVEFRNEINPVYGKIFAVAIIVFCFLLLRIIV